MFVEAFKSAWGVITRKPLVLWGLSLLSVVIAYLSTVLTITIPVLGMAIVFLISCGMAKVYLDGLDGKEVQADQMFAGFNKNCFRIAGGMAWYALWSVLWAIVPVAGVIKAYSYRFVPYILISKPEVTATQALKLSMKETEGLKGQMFLADLCFVGALIILILVLAVIAMIPVLGGVIMFLSILLIYAFTPIFVGLYQAYFYAHGKEYYNNRRMQQQYAYQNQYVNNGYANNGYGYAQNPNQNPNPYGNGQAPTPNGFGYGQNVNQQNGAYGYGQPNYVNNPNMYGQNVNPNNGYPQGNGFDQNNQFDNGQNQNNNYNGY